MAKILVVDDDNLIRQCLIQMLSNHGHNCIGSATTAEARDLLDGEGFDLILSDIRMPGESGLDFMQEALSTMPDTAVIMVTAVDDISVAKIALEAGAYGYILKPFDTNQVLINVANALRRRALEIANRQYQNELESMVADRTNSLRETTQKLRVTLDGVIKVMAYTVEMRDPYTSGHQKKVADLARAIVVEMGLGEDTANGVYTAGTVHDIGKISVPAELLSKPGRLTEIEFSLIKEHPRVGYEILNQIDFPWPLAEMVWQHHEKIDGSGYPQALSNKDILLEARILTVADVVEAIASHRPYRPALGVEVALEEIRIHKGRLYDYEVVEACLELFLGKGYQLVS